MQPSDKNPNPYNLDVNPTLSSVFHMCKKSVEDIQYRVDDYAKRTYASQAYNKTSISAKIRRHLDSMNQYKGMISELAE